MDGKTRIRAKCSTPKISYSLLRGDLLVGVVLAMSNGGWVVWDVEERHRLSPQLFITPQAAAKWPTETGLGT